MKSLGTSSITEFAIEAFANDLIDPCSTPHNFVANFDGMKVLDEKRTGPACYEIDDCTVASYKGVCYKSELLKKGGKCIVFHNKEYPVSLECDTMQKDSNRMAIITDAGKNAFIVPVIVPVLPEQGRDFLEWFIHLCRIYYSEGINNAEEKKSIKKAVERLSEHLDAELRKCPNSEALKEFKLNKQIILHFADKMGVQHFFKWADKHGDEIPGNDGLYTELMNKKMLKENICQGMKDKPSDRVFQKKLNIFRERYGDKYIKEENGLYCFKSTQIGTRIRPHFEKKKKGAPKKL